MKQSNEVNADRLQRLMALADQLVKNKTRIAKISDHLKIALADDQATSGQLPGGENTRPVIAGSMPAGSTAATGAEGEQSAVAEVDALRSHARRFQADLDTICGEINALAQVRSGISDLLDAFQQLEQECGTEVQLAESVERVAGPRNSPATAGSRWPHAGHASTFSNSSRMDCSILPLKAIAASGSLPATLTASGWTSTLPWTLMP